MVRAGEPLDHDLRTIGLLVLGDPTHALSLSRVSTRADAVTQRAAETSASSGMREWLLTAADMDERPPVAVFDTRARAARHWPGAASRATRRQLRRMGFTVVARASLAWADEGPASTDDRPCLEPSPRRTVGPMRSMLT